MNPGQELSAFSGISPIYDPIELINLAVAVIIIGAGLASLAYTLIGGFQFITSGGEPDKSQKALNTIRYSLIGLAVTIMAFTLVTIVGKVFGFDLIGYIDFNVIFRIVNSWTSGGGSGSIVLD